MLVRQRLKNKAKKIRDHFICFRGRTLSRLKYFANGAKAARDFWTDACLAAFARCAGLRLVSFDSGFTRYKELACLILQTGQ
jgi:predicted nucleic acid-binding protein